MALNLHNPHLRTVARSTVEARRRVVRPT
jgi:hypothetical protein